MDGCVKNHGMTTQDTYLYFAREEKFPQHLCVALKRLVFGALSSELFSKKDQPYEYQKFQLLLCASEICMQDRDYVDTKIRISFMLNKLYCMVVQHGRLTAVFSSVMDKV
ncbi:hypothetical protein ACLOJK_004036 [Asimina triloba]